jgi:serine/threonine protein phosphatase PrpC
MLTMAKQDLGASQVSRIFAAETMSDAQFLSPSMGTVAVFSAHSPDKASANEDAALVAPCGKDRGVLAVADGLGGHASGERASRVALEYLANSLQVAEKEGHELRYAILNAIEAANRALLEDAVGLATTLAVVEIDGSTVRPYHVGDSVILLFGQRGKIKLKTISHSPVGYAIESGLMDPQDAIHHDERHFISNVVGSADMRIEIGPTLRMMTYDTLLLASDGLLDNLHLEEIVAWARKGPLEGVAHLLANKAQERMQAPPSDHPSKPDDLTFILFRASRPPRGGTASRLPKPSSSE